MLIFIMHSGRDPTKSMPPRYPFYNIDIGGRGGGPVRYSRLQLSFTGCGWIWGTELFTRHGRCNGVQAVFRSIRMFVKVFGDMGAALVNVRTPARVGDCR